MKKFLVLVFISISFIGKAQVSCYAVGGNNVSFFNYDIGLGYYSGLMVDWQLSKPIGLQIGSQLSNIKINTSGPIYESSVSVNFKKGSFADLQYIEIPLSITYKILLSEQSAIKLNAGGYCGFGLGGGVYYHSENGDVKYFPATAVKEPFLSGLLTGIGFYKNNLLFGVEANFNLTDYTVPTYTLKTKFGIKF